MDWLRFDLTFLVEVVAKIGLTFLFALPIAWEREHATRIMGMRTFPLVSMASCGYVLVAAAVISDPGAADAHARIIQGLMSGIGFLGAGAILKEGATVRGTATAATVWMTGAIGGATAYSQYSIAIVLSIVAFFTLRLLTPFEEQKRKEREAKESESDSSGG